MIIRFQCVLFELGMFLNDWCFAKRKTNRFYLTAENSKQGSFSEMCRLEAVIGINPLGEI